MPVLLKDKLINWPRAECKSDPISEKGVDASGTSNIKGSVNEIESLLFIDGAGEAMDGALSCFRKTNRPAQTTHTRSPISTIAQAKPLTAALAG
jgi:hypothetical protein